MPRSRRIDLRCLALLVVLGGAHPLGAQGVIASDRPGIGSGSFVLQPGTIQLETGLDYAKGFASHAYSFGQALLRLGAPGFEVELFASSFVVTRGRTARWSRGRRGLSGRRRGLQAAYRTGTSVIAPASASIWDTARSRASSRTSPASS